MRRLALLLPLILTGCCGDLPTARIALPAVDIPPPISFKQDPKFVPSSYVQVVEQRAPAACQSVQTYTVQAQPQPAYRYAPVAPRAFDPCYGGGAAPYSPPPVPTPGGDDDIPEGVPPPGVRR